MKIKNRQALTLSHSELLALQDALVENQIDSKQNFNDGFKKNIKNQKQLIRKSKAITKNGVGKTKRLKRPEQVSNNERQRLLNEARERCLNYDSALSALINKDRNPIPDYEEGYPRPGWFTDEDWEKMRSQDFAAIKKNHKE
jgi:hypothetical protein